MKRIFQQHTLLTALLVTFILWLILFWQGLTTAYSVWLTSEIYNHCLLIIPISMYLIYEKWPQIAGSQPQPFYPALGLTLGCVLVQIFAQIGDIKILMHLATFTALPLMVWFIAGNAISKVIFFPLCFILFAIPIGDQLVPFLQEITTDIAVPLLNITGVPVYRNGLYLDIPEGRFLVAEACSGISFLITTIAFGFLYAYLFFKTWKRKLLFVGLSLLIPILANALRVYGIILTGHLSDMEYAVGADHLIYGGVFFAIVLFLLIAFGELIKEPKKAPEDTNTQNQEQKNEEEIDSDNRVIASAATTTLKKSNKVALLNLIIVAAVFHLWLNISSSSQSIPVASLVEKRPAPQIALANHAVQQWAPKFSEGLVQKMGTVNVSHLIADNNQLGNTEVEFFAAYFDGERGKLISSTHRDYDQKDWSLLQAGQFYIQDKPVYRTILTSPPGTTNQLYKWYKIGDKHFASEGKAKLYQAWRKMWSQPANGFAYILSVRDPAAVVQVESLKLEQLESHLQQAFVSE